MEAIMNPGIRQLKAAEQRAKELFVAVEQTGMIAPGKTERELAGEIVALAKSRFGIRNFWHKKIVRAGANTLCSYSGNPPDVVIQQDDVVILDFGPVFRGYEADLGRTYVIGTDPLKLKLKNDVEQAWHEAKDWYYRQNNLTGAQYYNYAVELAKKYGWEWGGEIAGHIVGHFPHEQLAPHDLGLDVHPDNHADILQRDKNGNQRAWILEIQFIDREKEIGGFFEQLLN